MKLQEGPMDLYHEYEFNRHPLKGHWAPQEVWGEIITMGSLWESAGWPNGGGMYLDEAMPRLGIDIIVYKSASLF